MGAVMREVGDWARRRKAFAGLFFLLTLGLGILIGSVISGRVAANRPVASDAAMLRVPSPVQLSSEFATIVHRVEPAVVNISTTQVIQTPIAHSRPGDPTDPYGDFFHRFFSDPNMPQADRSLGSGVILDPRGYILTNEHVIDGATRIDVTLSGDPTKYVARLVGTDGETDLAVIKINAGHPLPVARLGNSNAVSVGDWVLAFGSPFMLQGTVTAGIVSAKDRSRIGMPLQHFIQTDAPINPGNSGGPLVDMAGQVIGIDTAIYTSQQGFEGVGFALPSDTAVGVYNQLVAHGHVTRGSIGVSFARGRENPIALKELGASYGVILESVEPNSPAARAGMRAGDVVVSVNGQPVLNGDDMVNPILATPIGQSVKVGYIRNGKRYVTPVLVANRDKLFPQLAEVAASQPNSAPAAPAENRGIGLTLDQLTPALSAKLHLGNLTRGVIVRAVEPASFADDVGFARGEVIVEVNHVPVYTVSDFERVLERVRPGQDVLFKVEGPRSSQTDQNLTLFLAGVMPEER
jgi:serine protease Do